jgi:hypothetical protein
MYTALEVFMRKASINGLFLSATALLASVAALSCASSQKPPLSETLAAEVRQDGDARVFRGGRLVTMEGVPVLTLTGTPREMGLQYGVLLKERLSEANREIDAFIDSILASRNVFERAFAPLAISSYTRGMRKRIPAEFLEELAGMAEGSGLPEDRLAFIAAGAGIFGQPMENSVPHCTSILARLPDRIIHGRNFDFLPALMGKFPVVVHYKPPAGNGYWNFGVIGYLPVFHGINEKGISVTLNYGVASYDGKAEGPPSGYKIRRLLQNAGTMAEAREILKTTPADEPGWIFTVESADEGLGSVFDIIGNERAESRFEEPDYKMVLNRVFSPARYKDGALAKKYLTMSDAEGEYNIARFTSGTKFMANKPVSSVEEMLAFLRNTSFYGYDIPLDYNGSIANDYTIHTLVFDWKSRRVLFTSGLSYAPLHAVKALDLRTDTLAAFAPADPKLSTDKYGKFVASMIEFQNRMLAEDRAWVAAHTDFDTADPYLVAFNIETLEHSPSLVDRDVLLNAVDRLIGQYPDYNLPYALKAALFEGKNPEEASALYAAALGAPISFVPDRIVHLSKIAELKYGMGKKVEAAAAAAKCLAILDEMAGKYVLEEWAVKIQKRMTKLAGR